MKKEYKVKYKIYFIRIVAVRSQAREDTVYSLYNYARKSCFLADEVDFIKIIFKFNPFCAISPRHILLLIE